MRAVFRAAAGVSMASAGGLRRLAKGLSEAEFRQRFGTEVRCRQVLFEMRWRDGLACPACGHCGFCELKGRKLFQCNRCKKQVRLTVGTVFQDSKLPLVTWFAAIYHLTQSKGGISSVELGRRLRGEEGHGLAAGHKLMQAMAGREAQKPKLAGRIELDDSSSRSTASRARNSPKCCRTWPSVVDDICIIKSVNTDQFNHAPAQIFLNTGFAQPGRPSIGSWVTYGLGAETQDLPAFVVMSTGGGHQRRRGQLVERLPADRLHRRPLPQPGRPDPGRHQPDGHRRQAAARLARPDRRRSTASASSADGDPEIATRIAAYEMAYRLQTSAPELMDLRQRVEGDARPLRLRPGQAVVRPGLPARAADGRARRALRQHLPRRLGRPLRRRRQPARPTAGRPTRPRRRWSRT